MSDTEVHTALWEACDRVSELATLAQKDGLSPYDSEWVDAYWAAVLATARARTLAEAQS